jgi:hypothetical protein
LSSSSTDHSGWTFAVQIAPVGYHQGLRAAASPEGDEIQTAASPADTAAGGHTKCDLPCDFMVTYCRAR